MGNNQSFGHVQPINPDGDVFAIVPYNFTGKLMVIGLPNSSPVITSICQSLATFIGRQVDAVSTEPYVTTIKSRTNFKYQQFEPALKLKLSWTAIFFNLHRLGYRPLISTDMQRYDHVENFQLFERTNEPPPQALALVSLSSYGKFQIVTETGYHDEIMQSMTNIVTQHWGTEKSYFMVYHIFITKGIKPWMFVCILVISCFPFLGQTMLYKS
jgi:hypothetical protein